MGEFMDYEILVNSKVVGNIFTLHPLATENIEKDCSVVGFEINFSIFLSLHPYDTKGREKPHKSMLL